MPRAKLELLLEALQRPPGIHLVCAYCPWDWKAPLHYVRPLRETYYFWRNYCPHPHVSDGAAPIYSCPNCRMDILMVLSEQGLVKVRRKQHPAPLNWIRHLLRTWRGSLKERGMALFGSYRVRASEAPRA